MKCSFELSKANTLIISAEKMMYGVVFMKISRHEKGLIVSYSAIADGGDVCGEDTYICEGKSLDPALKHIIDSEYPDKEVDESSYSWGIQIGDNEDNLIAEIERKYWGEDSAEDLLSCVEDVIGSCESLEALRNLMGF